MKKIYSFILLAIAMLLPVVAKAAPVNFKINVNDPAGCTVTVGYGGAETLSLVAGENNVSVEEYRTVGVVKNAGWDVKVTHPEGYTISDYGDGAFYYPDASHEGKTLNIVCTPNGAGGGGSSEDMMTFVLNVDDPSKISAFLDGQSEFLSLNAGDNTISYDFTKTRYLYVGKYPAPYSIKAFNESGSEAPNAIFDNFENFGIDLDIATRVEIRANAPATDGKVKFVFTNPGTEGFVKTVYVSGSEVPVSSFIGDGYTVSAGSTVGMSVDGDNYVVNYGDVTINGEAFSIYSWGEFTVQGDTEVKFTVNKVQTSTATVKVIGDLAGLKVRKNYNDYTLPSNESTVEFTSSQNQISFEAKAGYYIESITVNGEAKTAGETIYLKANDVIEVTVKAKVYDNSMIVYINIDPSTLGYFSMINSARESFTLKQGYNTIPFSATDAPFNMSFWASSNPEFFYYRNDEPLAPKYEGGNYVEFTPANNDVIKFYINTNGANGSYTHAVKFNTNTEEISIKKDLVKSMTLTANTDFKTDILDGTQFEIAATDGANITVKVGDNYIEPVDGKFNFAITAPTSVDVRNPLLAGIDEIEANTIAPVYNLQGVKVAESDNIDHLPAGLYIVNGKKLIKK